MDFQKLEILKDWALLLLRKVNRYTLKEALAWKNLTLTTIIASPYGFKSRGSELIKSLWWVALNQLKGHTITNPNPRLREGIKIEDSNLTYLDVPTTHTRKVSKLGGIFGTCKKIDGCEKKSYRGIWGSHLRLSPSYSKGCLSSH